MPRHTPLAQRQAVWRNKKKNLDWFKEYKKKLKCKVCGEDDPNCLDFHHRPGTVKKYAIPQAMLCSFKTGLKEMAKCDVLCSNCHRKEHARLKADALH